MFVLAFAVCSPHSKVITDLSIVKKLIFLWSFAWIVLGPFQKLFGILFLQPDGTDLRRFVYDHETWANYLTCMEQDGTWGDHVILCAAANCFKTCIHVVRSLNDDVVIRPHGLVDESKPLVLGHIGEVHYVSLQPIKGKKGKAHVTRFSFWKW